jgi:hypothetical protein
MEHLIHVDDEDERRRTREFFSRTYYVSQQAMFWQRQAWDAKAKARNKELSDVERAKLENDVFAAHVEAKNCLLQLKNLAGTANALRPKSPK